MRKLKDETGLTRRILKQSSNSGELSHREARRLINNVLALPSHIEPLVEKWKSGIKTKTPPRPKNFKSMKKNANKARKVPYEKTLDAGFGLKTHDGGNHVNIKSLKTTNRIHKHVLKNALS
jgi:hypothetical protein